MSARPPAELRLWTWLKANGLRQSDVAQALDRSDQAVSHRMKYAGFTPEEQKAVLSWARRIRPKAKVEFSDLFEAEAA